jgi:hypothetical protein
MSGFAKNQSRGPRIYDLTESKSRKIKYKSSDRKILGVKFEEALLKSLAGTTELNHEVTWAIFCLGIRRIS